MSHVRRIVLGLVGLSGLAGCIVDPEVLRITHGFQSEPSAISEQIIMLRVAVHAPDGQPPAFSWSTRSGRLSNPQETATESMILWMAPPCPSTESGVDITATAKDAQGYSVSKVFHVNLDCASTP